MSSKLLILISFAIISEVGYSLLAPLYPFIAKNLGLSDSLIGLVFSSFAISNFFSTLLTPFLISLIGRKNTLYLALFTEGLCSILFGLISFISNKTAFTFLSFAVRFAQGAGGAFSQTLIYSLTAAISDKESIERNIGYIELGCSVGVAIGPLLASIGYYLFGFEFPFIFSGIVEILMMKLVTPLEIEESDKDEGEVSVIEILTNKNIFMTFLAVMIDMISISFIYPVFATHLNSIFGLSPEIISLFFIIETITYFISIQCLNHVNRFFGNKFTMVLGTITNATFILFLSPVRFLPQLPWVVCVGLGGLGVAGALVSIPAVIDIIETMKNELGIEEHVAQDYSSAIFNLGYFFGETLGPLMGGYLTDQFNFEVACNYNSAFNFIFGISFAVFILSGMKKRKEEKGKKIEIVTD